MPSPGDRSAPRFDRHPPSLKRFFDEMDYLRNACGLSPTVDLTIIGSLRRAVTPQVNFPWKITFDTLYTNEFLLGVRSRALAIPSERTTI